MPASARWQLDLRSGSIDTVIWATGFRPEYGWLDVPVVDAKGRIVAVAFATDPRTGFAIAAPVSTIRSSVAAGSLEALSRCDD